MASTRRKRDDPEAALGSMMADPDRDGARRAAEAMLKMKKLDIGLLTAAFDGR